jgi:hypothetical protein
VQTSCQLGGGRCIAIVEIFKAVAAAAISGLDCNAEFPSIQSNNSDSEICCLVWSLHSIQIG